MTSCDIVPYLPTTVRRGILHILLGRKLNLIMMEIDNNNNHNDIFRIIFFRVFNLARSILGVLATVRCLDHQLDRQRLHGHHHRGRLQHGGRQHPPSNPQRNVDHAMYKSNLFRFVQCLYLGKGFKQGRVRLTIR